MRLDKTACRPSSASFLTTQGARLACADVDSDRGTEICERVSPDMGKGHPPQPPIVATLPQREGNIPDVAACKPDIQRCDPRRPFRLPTKHRTDALIPKRTPFRGCRCSIFLLLARTELRMDKANSPETRIALALRQYLLDGVMQDQFSIENGLGLIAIRYVDKVEVNVATRYRAPITIDKNCGANKRKYAETN